ncbi:hypothetical protein EI545_02330 [Tabrizicola piscis]|uniref:Uncharacterized protein n=1 Tax=Tabrizicola piscis TaxID=2494374 RepID=A0A3S8UBI3_9RHOB|nr:hypothetical protein EI545_02330 [Tabrizicola piscis]
MSGPNPLSPFHMSPAERRAELCRILALGLIRLHMRQSSELSDVTGESSLHFPPEQRGHATPNERRTA